MQFQYSSLVSLAEPAGLSLTWLETPDRFSHNEAHVDLAPVQEMSPGLA